MKYSIPMQIYLGVTRQLSLVACEMTQEENNYGKFHNIKSFSEKRE